MDMSHLSEEQLDKMIDDERMRPQASLNEWGTIAARAREEGLIREIRSARAWGSGQPWLQAAAAVLLLIGGIAIGRTTTALPSAIQSSASNSTAPAPGSTAISSGSASSAAGASFASVAEASATLDRAVKEYQLASRFLAATNSSVVGRDSTAMYSARAAALDKIVDATESALETAPRDPVINQYYLTTVSAREATLRQLGTTLRPEGVSLSRF